MDVQILDTVGGSGRHLPKWPQMLVRGEQIEPEVALGIIFRTDNFILRGYGANNREWDEWAHETLGTEIFYYRCDKFRQFDDIAIFDATVAIREHVIGCVDTEYVQNDWMSSGYIGGPHGWCSPDGQISYGENVGKWPTVEEVAEDWKTILEAFPFLRLRATLMDDEYCEESAQPVVSIEVGDGKVVLTDNHLDRSEVPSSSSDSLISAIHSKLFNPRSEQGIVDKHVVAIGEIWKPKIDAILKEHGIDVR